MSKYNSSLSGLHSLIQKIDFYNESFNGVYSVGLTLESMDLPSVPGFRSHICNLKTEKYELLKRRQINLTGIRFHQFVNFKITPRVQVEKFNGVRSNVQIINVGERRYVIVGRQSYPLFDPNTIVVTMSKIKLSPSVLSSINKEPNYRYKLDKSHYHGIFNGAINAKRVLLTTAFSIYVPSAQKIRIGRHLYSKILSPYTKWRIMNDSYDRCIVFSFVPHGGIGRTMISMSTATVSPYQQAPQESRNLRGVKSGRFSIERKVILKGMRSPEIPFHSKLESFNGVKQRMTMRLFNRGFNGMKSTKFNILRVRNHSSFSAFKSLRGVRFNLFSVKTRVYARNELIYIPASKYFFARQIGTKDLGYIKSNLCRFRIPFTIERGFNGIASNAILMKTTIVPIERQDFNGIRSNWMRFIAGDKELINKNGLYRDVFIDSTKEITHFRTPWTPKESSMIRIKKGKFYGISFTSGLDVFKIEKATKNTMLINWEMVTLSKEHWMIPEFGLAPYIKAETADKSDFIILSVSPAGGSVVHMHKGGFKESFSVDGGYSQQEFIAFDDDGEEVELVTIDSSRAEDAAIVVGSNRYKRFARILYESERGGMWDVGYQEDAKKYMDIHRDKTLFFYDAPYSPTVLRSIILDKSKGLLTKNIFSKPEIYCYGDTEETMHPCDDPALGTTCEDSTIYIHEVEEDIPESGMIYSFVTKHEDIRLKKSASKVAMTFSNTNVGMSKTGPIIDNCSVGTLCSRVIMSTPSVYTGVFSRAIMSHHTSYWITNRGAFSYGVKVIESPISPGDNISIPGFRSKKFVNIKTSRYLSGVRSAIIGFESSIGTFLNGLKYTSRFTTGLRMLHGVSSVALEFKTRTFSTSLNGTLSDFKIKLHLNLLRDKFKGVQSVPVPVSINKGVVSWKGVSNNRVESIWLKMFPQHFAGKSTIETQIMKFHITDREFDKPMFFPFDYADPDARPDARPSKSGSRDFIEKKMVEIPDILGPTPVSPSVLNQLCGDFRSTTLLEYEGFDHIFREGDNQIFGRLTWKDRKFIMSAYLRIRENVVIKKGVKLSEADILRRTLAEVRLSAIDDLSVVEDWHIEDFKLEAEDFGLLSSESEKLSSIDDAFRTALKSVLESIGDDATSRERSKGEDQFPAFPERRIIGDELSKTIKPKQYFMVEEVKK